MTTQQRIGTGLAIAGAALLLIAVVLSATFGGLR